MVVSGYPSRGKSTFVDNLLVNLTKKYGFKHLVASFENTIGNYYKTIFEMYKQEPFWKILNQGKEFAITQLLGSEDFFFLNEHFILFDNKRLWTIDDICKRAELEVMKHGIKTLVIDPYNRLKNDYSEREDKYIGSILAKLCMLAKRLNILVIFVAHPKKPDAEELPTMYSISGSGDWYNMSDYGIIVHRERDDFSQRLENTPTIHVAKVKNFSLGDPAGGKVKLLYNSNKRVLEDLY